MVETKMSWKKLLLVLAALFCIILAVFYMGYHNIGKNAENQPQKIPPETQPQDNPPDLPEGPEFVVPESPIGTLGLISALATAFGIFAITKKRKYAQNFVS